MKSFTHHRLVPIACLMFMCGLLLTSLSLLLDTPVPEKFLVTKSSIKVFALLDVGKWVKSQAHEQYREDMREGFSVGTDAWIALYCSPAAKLNLVRTQKDARTWLQKNLHAKYVGKTDILRVWLTDGSPQDQAIIVDTILRDFLQYIERDRMPSLKKEIVWSRSMIGQLNRVLVIRETDLRKLVSSVALNMSMSQLRELLERLCNLMRDVAFFKGRATFFHALIQQDEVLLRTQPRIVKWASKPRPEK